ncbi:hypothetical protein G6F24_011785 [Rhizopus arrhizus]|nr:hypothetical protein G6F24_011785 [Rhizopus arrhizus]
MPPHPGGGDNQQPPQPEPEANRDNDTEATGHHHRQQKNNCKGDGSPESAHSTRLLRYLFGQGAINDPAVAPTAHTVPGGELGATAATGIRFCHHQ